MRAFEGRLVILGDDVDTDAIVPGRYLGVRCLDEVAAHAFESHRPGLAARLRKGDILLAGRNFGCGSSREQAVHVLIRLGVGCLAARSYSRIFFRNGVTLGLPLFTLRGDVETALLAEWSPASVNPEWETITLPLRDGGRLSVDLEPITGRVREMLEAGGLIPFMRGRSSPGAGQDGM